MNPVDPIFPPRLTGYPVVPPQTPFSTATQGAKDNRKFGAGDVLWSQDTDTVQWAIVLEPDVALCDAQQVLPLAMVAMGDCIGALTPPKVAVNFRWPGTILINDGEAGSFYAATDKDAGEQDIPDWLVIGVDLRLSYPFGSEPGETPHLTALSEEGGENIDRTLVIESFSRHFLTWLNLWKDDGFKPVADAWLFRGEGYKEEISVDQGGEGIDGTFLGFDEQGNLLLRKGSGEIACLPLLEHFDRH